MKLPIIILISVIVFLISIISVYAYIEIKKLNESITEEKIRNVDLIANHVQSKINQLAVLMKVTSTSPLLAQLPLHTNMISWQLKGIPENVEIEKRQTAKDIMQYASDIEYVFYSLPNGDIYFLEPYSTQIALSQENFAFRDWYKGVTETKETYISEAYISANVYHKVIAIAVPLYETNSTNNSMIGIWVGAINLVDFNNEMSGMTFGKGESVLVSDFNNNVVVDSRKTSHENVLLTAPFDLRGKSQGETKTGEMMLNGTKMFVVFKPITIGTHQWQITSIQPYDEAFLASTAILNESVLMILIILVVFGTSGFIIIRAIKKKEMISKKLEEANILLEKHAEQLRQVDLAKEEFSAMITHELKTPLVPILGYCKMLKTSMFGKLPQEIEEAVEIIEKNAKRLGELIGDIMDSRKLDLGKMKFNFENLQLHEFFNTLDQSYKETLRDKGIGFVTKLSCRDSIVNVDQTRLRQVFDNLISNSMKFVPVKNGLIEVGGYNENHDVILYVKDNGIGIPKDKQKNLFKKFYQIDTSYRREIGGTGLGLSISKGIMENMGGTIWVESDGKTGTTLLLRLKQI